jgi:hypothetical protein
MTRTDDWILGIRYNDGTVDVTRGGGIDADSVSEIVFPVSRPWSDRADTYPAPLKFVQSDERNMGSEDHYVARVEDSGPSSGQDWEMEFRYVEYMDPIASEVTHTDNVTAAVWDADDLMDAIS